MLIDFFLGQEFLLKASLAGLAGAMTASDDQPGGMIFQDSLQLPQKIHSCFWRTCQISLLSFLDLSCTCSGWPFLHMFWSTKFVCFIFFPCHIVVLFVWWRLSMSTIVEWRNIGGQKKHLVAQCGSKCHPNHVRITGAKWSRVAMQKCLKASVRKKCEDVINNQTVVSSPQGARDNNSLKLKECYTYSEKQGHREIAVLLVTDSCLIAPQQAHPKNRSCFLSWLALFASGMTHVHNWQDMAMESMDSYGMGITQSQNSHPRHPLSCWPYCASLWFKAACQEAEPLRRCGPVATVTQRSRGSRSPPMSSARGLHANGKGQPARSRSSHQSQLIGTVISDQKKDKKSKKDLVRKLMTTICYCWSKSWRLFVKTQHSSRYSSRLPSHWVPRLGGYWSSTTKHSKTQR